LNEQDNNVYVKATIEKDKHNFDSETHGNEEEIKTLSSCSL